MTKNNLTENRYSKYQTIIFIFISMLLGTFLRIQYFQKTDFVLNDGGMFFSMIKDLQNNHYLLPVFTTYNLSQIPYAYPPLSFYAGAFINQFLNIDIITIFRLYPLLFNVLSIPAFYLLSMEITQDYHQSVLAMAFYALMLPGFDWLITGGGLTRSPSHTYFILALALYLAFSRTKQRKFYILSIIFAALMTLHHLEYCLLLIFSIYLFSIERNNLKTDTKNIFFFLIGVGFLTSPYWLTVINYQGVSPFISALKTGEFDFISSFIKTILLLFTQETVANFINILGVIGLLYCLFTKKYRLIIWFVLINFINPRSEMRILVLPIAIFAAVAVTRVVYPGFLNRNHTNDNSENITGSKPLNTNLWENFGQIVIGFSILFPFILGYISTLQYNPILSSISADDREAMQWIKSNTPADSTFVIMDQSLKWEMDMIGEWFPALSERKSITTIQGTEWLSNSSFELKETVDKEFRNCINSGEECINRWANKNQIIFTNIYISKTECNANSINCLNFFITTFRNSTKYHTIFENDGVVVFEKNN